ncbi:MAG: MFS transporter [Candidatus Nanopelagicales bacterium]
MNSEFALSESQIKAVQNRTLSVLTAAQVLSGVGIAATVAAGSLLVASITGSEAMAGLAQTFGVLGAAALALPLAALTRRGGRRIALSLGYFLGSVGAVFAIIGGVYRLTAVVLLGTFLVGAASAAGYQARFAAVDLAKADSRAKHLSIVVWGSTFGAVLGPNLMAPFGYISASLGLPQLVGPYLLAVFMLGLGAILISLGLSPDPYLLSYKIMNQFKEVTSNNSAKLALKNIAQSQNALIGLLAIVIGHIAMVSIMVMTPIHMAHVDVSLQLIGLVISVHIAGMYALSPVMGWMADYFGRIATIGFGVITLLFSALIAGLSAPDQVVGLGIGLFLLGLGWSATLIAGSTLLSESVTLEQKAASQGASDLIMNLAGAVGGAVAGVIIATLSYGWLCLMSSIPVAIFGSYLLVQKVNKRD